MTGKPASAPLNQLKAQLRAGREVCLSIVVRYSRTAEIAALAKAAGFHSLYVDLEHAPLSPGETSGICIAAQALGVTPLVRIPPGRLDVIGQALDGGALGIIVPHIETADQARLAVSAARFAPAGTRSAAGPAVQLGFRPVPAAEANARLNEETLVVVMVESAEGVKNVDIIAATDGVDMLMVGTNDLLADWGLAGQFDHPALADAYAAILEAGRQHDTFVGIGGLSSRLDLARGLVSDGARYVSVGTDITFVLRGARAAIVDLGLGNAAGGGA